MADVAEIHLGRQRSPQHHSGDQMRPYLRSANVTWGGIDLSDVKEMNFDDADFEKYRLRAGDLLLNEASGSPNEVGKPAVWRDEIDDCCFQNTLLRLQPCELDRRYVYWYCYLSARTGRFGDAGRGVNIRHLGKQGLAQFPIPIAPVAEQTRIVSAIEEHFSRLDAAEAATDSSVNRISSLLEAAVQAQLDRYPTSPVPLHRFLTQRLSNGRSVPTATTDGFPVLRLTCLRDGTVATSETKQGDFGDADPTRYVIEPDDFLISRGNGSRHLVGLGGLVPAGASPVAYPDTLIRARVDQSRLRPNFLSHVWNSQLVREQVEAQARTTAGIYKINQTMIEQVSLPIPCPDDQDRIARQLDELRSSVRMTEREVERVRQRIAELRRSILADAFSGRLVPQDPDDEPASMLLERIAASRAAEPPTATRRSQNP